MRTWLLASSLAFLISAASLHSAGDHRLIDAVRDRNRAAMDALLKQRVDVNVTGPDGATALHWAAHWDDREIADVLIRAGAKVDVVNDFGVTPLSMAAVNGSAAMIAVLIKAGANANLTSPAGEAPLMTAARTGNTDAVRALLDGRADIRAQDPSRGQTALMWAAAEGHSEVTRLLIERGADVHARSKAGFTPLLFAARAGDLDTNRILIAAGARVNDRASDGTTSLLMAVVRGHHELTRFLLDRGADPNADGTGYTVLHWAAGTWETGLRFPDYAQAVPTEWHAVTGVKGQRKLDVLEALLAHGADPNARTGRTPTRFGFSAAGGDPYYELKGATPFLIAAMAGDADAMRVLAAAGADPRLPTSDNMTPLMEAAGIGRVPGETIVTETAALAAVKLAHELGGNVNAVDDRGETALHGAAALGLDSIVQFLVEQGANVNMKNKDGESPLTIASGKAHKRAGDQPFHPSTADLLRKAGAIQP
jgi:uncharacterized protein